MRPVSIALTWLVTASWIAGCATERLAAAAPGGVDLSGEWKFDPNLSDDPNRLADPEETPQRSPGGHRGHGGGRGGGGGMPPIGSPGGSYNFVPTASGSGPAPGTLNRLLQAPVHMSIVQTDGALVIKFNMADGTRSTEEYRAGTQTTIPYGNNGTAARSVGWRGPVFVVTTAVKKGGRREDDFALDDDGRLIMTTQTNGGRLGKLEIKRVYDRERGAAMAATRNETGTPGPAR